MTDSDWVGIEEAVAIRFAGSFTAAARQLGVSTSQVSRAIAELERRVQAQIFIRTTRSCRTTDTGRVLIDQFERLIRQRQEILASASGQGSPHGALRVTCPLSLGERFLSPIVRAFATDFPALDVTLDLRNRVVDLINENYDLAVRTGVVADERLVRVKIAAQGIGAVASPEFLDRHGLPETPSALEGLPCVVGESALWRFIVGGQPLAIRPKGRWRSNSGASVVDAALAGLGVCQLPDYYVEDLVRAGRLVRILEAFRPPAEPIWAVYPQQRHLEPKVRLLVDRLKIGLRQALAGVGG
jgi:DNA-binding transcriptional LysR family regulator